jgi:hypothetical protein
MAGTWPSPGAPSSANATAAAPTPAPGTTSGASPTSAPNSSAGGTNAGTSGAIASGSAPAAAQTPPFDPSRARVEWAVTTTSGGATAADVRRALSRVSGAFSGCYQSALRAGGQRADGTATLRLSTDDEGNVIQANLSGFALSGVDTCIASAARVRIAGVDTGRAWAEVKLAFRAEPGE